MTAATCTPYCVAVVVTVVPLAVMVEVATEVAVVEAVQPAHEVQGAPVDQVPEVQPVSSCQYKSREAMRTAARGKEV